jgi:hypothetical protein
VRRVTYPDCHFRRCPTTEFPIRPKFRLTKVQGTDFSRLVWSPHCDGLIRRQQLIDLAQIMALNNCSVFIPLKHFKRTMPTLTHSIWLPNSNHLVSRKLEGAYNSFMPELYSLPYPLEPRHYAQQPRCSEAEYWVTSIPPPS